VEPTLSDDDYIEYLLETCKRLNINALIPYHKSLLIAKNISKFNDIGTEVLMSKNIELLELIDNKVLFYEDIQPKNIIKIPEYYTVNTKDEFISAYNKLKEKGKVCFKPIKGVGGVGFRVITESKNSVNDILNAVLSKYINLEYLLNSMEKEDTFQSIMVMEYLDGYEYSIDCLADRDGNLVAAIPRKKIDKHNRYLEDNKYLIEIAKKISEVYKIPYAFNIQVRYKNNEVNLLEINTRMSGGVHYSCISGINIPYEAVNNLLGYKITPNLDINSRLDIIIGSINTPKISIPMDINSYNI